MSALDIVWTATADPSKAADGTQKGEICRNCKAMFVLTNAGDSTSACGMCGHTLANMTYDGSGLWEYTMEQDSADFSVQNVEDIISADVAASDDAVNSTTGDN